MIAQLILEFLHLEAYRIDSWPFEEILPALEEGREHSYGGNAFIVLIEKDCVKVILNVMEPFEEIILTKEAFKQILLDKKKELMTT